MTSSEQLKMKKSTQEETQTSNTVRWL